MNQNLSRRPATEADVPFLYALRLESMDPHLVAAGMVLSPGQHMERVRDKLDSAEILIVDGTPAGMIKIAREDGYWHIMQLQVVPVLHGSGVGSDILERVIAEARIAKVQLTLGVLKVNPAKRLYERLGFMIRGESKFEYEMLWRGTPSEWLADFQLLERALHAACASSNIARVTELIHADFSEFGRSGKIWSKASLLSALAESPGPELHSQDFAILSRSLESCLLTYRSAHILPDGKLARHTLRSSLWIRVDNNWQLIFHQGTACEALSVNSAE